MSRLLRGALRLFHELCYPVLYIPRLSRSVVVGSGFEHLVAIEPDSILGINITLNSRPRGESKKFRTQPGK